VVDNNSFAHGFSFDLNWGVVNQACGGRSKSRNSVSSASQKLQFTFVSNLGAIAGAQIFAIQGQLTAHHLHKGQDGRRQAVTDGFASTPAPRRRSRASWPMVVLPAAPSGEATRCQWPRISSTVSACCS
jgi:hypothetical protein